MPKLDIQESPSCDSELAIDLPHYTLHSRYLSYTFRLSCFVAMKIAHRAIEAKKLHSVILGLN